MARVVGDVFPAGMPPKAPALRDEGGGADRILADRRSAKANDVDTVAGR